MQYSSYNFSHAISRLPARSLVDGLRAVDTGQPSYEQFLVDHKNYVETLRETGATVLVLDALEEYPDSVFVEDAVLCLNKLAIIMRPGAPSRLGEASAIKPEIMDFYSIVKTIEGPGFIEGGDILVTEQEILVGRSARTDSAGIDELTAIVSPYGYNVREVNTPEGVLHFKTDCSLLDEKTILSTERLAATGCFSNYDVIHVAEGEEACANSIRFNQYVIMPDGFPLTQKIIEEKGFVVKTIGNSEAAKLDGGMSCLSLRFTPS